MSNFINIEKSSYRDHNSTVCYYKDLVLRKVKKNTDFDFKLFLNSKYFNENKDKIVPTKILNFEKIEKEHHINFDLSNFIWLQHKKIKNILYPYELCFNQLKDTAIVYLDLYLKALEHNLEMSDASAYNFQRLKNKIVLIDVSSFVKLKENKFFIPHKQFCENFLAPLCISAYSGIDFNNLFKSNINGIDLELASKILPNYTIFNYQLLTNIHLHSFLNSKISSVTKKSYDFKKGNKIFSLQNKKLVINNLKKFIYKIKFKKKTYWSSYSKFNSYNTHSENYKKHIVTNFVKQQKAKSLIDVGCNNGEYSKIGFKNGINEILSLDNDMSSLNQVYDYFVNKNIDFNCMYQDFLNPSSNIGWLNEERKSFKQRFKNKYDIMICLAFIHHICIKNNVPLKQFVDYIFNFSNNILLEFVPKEDPMVQEMIFNKSSLLENYNLQNLKKIIYKDYILINEQNITGTQRTLLHIKKKYNNYK